MTLSIITVNKNNAAGLEKTIQSVICQTSSDFEYIIIDGDSTDDSVNTIKNYSEKINYWISEPDTGIYNAMNKGIKRAQGDYCLFLNSGDRLITEETINNVFSEVNNSYNSEIYYSNRINSDGSIKKYPQNIDINYLIHNPISHQNSLIKRNLFLKHGLYNENLRIASDWEFFIRESWIHKVGFIYLKTNIAIFDINGIGSQNTAERFLENSLIIKNIFDELSISLLELKEYHSSIYGNIIKNYGSTKILVFILRFYRFFLSRTKKIIKFLT